MVLDNQYVLTNNINNKQQLITTDTPKGEDWPGTTDENGKMDLKYPLSNIFSEIRSLTFTVKAKGDGISR